LSDFLRPGTLITKMRADSPGRYVLHVPGFDLLRADPFATVNEVEETQGYDPVQLLRYWTFARAVSSRPMRNNVSLLYEPLPVARDVLHIRWFSARSTSDAIPAGSKVVARGGGPRRLFELPDAPPRASLVGDFEVVSDADAALEAVTAGSFDPEATVVLEREPGVEPGEAASSGRATYEAVGEQAARIEVDTPEPALLLVRNVYDPNWRATVDGRPVDVLAADYIVQAVPVPAGTHTVELRYIDPSIAYGLIGSALVLSALVAVAYVAFRRERSHSSHA
jgi:hypothetical protein